MSNETKYERWPFLKELERVFNIINKDLFDGVLPLPVFVVRHDKKVVFRFLPDSYTWVVGSKFTKSKMTAIIHEFAHEMIHVENHRRGLVDRTSNQYHNKRFLETALEKGFFVSQDPSRGWSKTKLVKSGNCHSPSETANDNLIKCLESITLDQSLIEEGQEEVSRIITSSAPAKICFLKYVCACPPPHNSIRSGRRPDGQNPLKIKCMICKTEFACEGNENPVKE